VTLLDPSTGAAIASTRTDASGGFYFVGRPLPTTFVVDASTTVSDLATDHGHLRREVAGGQMTSLWVTPATHLAWVYHQAHPELDATQAANRVKQFLVVGPLSRYDLGYSPTEALATQFSLALFVQQAAAEGGVGPYCQSLIPRIDGGQTQSFALADFGVSVLSNVLGDVVTDGITTVTSKLVGVVAGALGFNFGTKAMYNEVVAQLNAIQEEIAALQQDVNQQFAGSALQQALAQMSGLYIEPVQNATIHVVQTAQNPIAGQNPGALNPPSTFSALLSTLDQAVTNAQGGNALTGINDYMLGQAGLESLYKQAVTFQQTLLHLSASQLQNLQGYNMALDVFKLYGFAEKWQILALMTVCESAYSLPSPAISLGTAQQNAARLLQNLYAQKAQFVPVLPDSDLLIIRDYSSKVYTVVQGQVDYQTAQSIALQSFSYGDFSGFTMLTAQVYQQLEPIAATVGNGSPTAGLKAMGFNVGDMTDDSVLYLANDQQSGQVVPVLVTGEVFLYPFIPPSGYYLLAEQWPYPGQPDYTDANWMAATGTPASMTLASDGNSVNASMVFTFLEYPQGLTSTQPFTQYCLFTSDRPDVCTVSNAPGHQGALVWHPDAQNTVPTQSVKITGQFKSPYGAVSSSITVNPPAGLQPRKLVSIYLSPRAIEFDGLATPQQFNATGFYSDGLVTDITNTVTWSVSDATVGSFNTAGLLSFNPALAATTPFNVTATMDGVTSTTNCEVVPP
jgi:hypothetical protein